MSNSALTIIKIIQPSLVCWSHQVNSIKGIQQVREQASKRANTDVPIVALSLSNKRAYLLLIYTNTAVQIIPFANQQKPYGHTHTHTLIFCICLSRKSLNWIENKCHAQGFYFQPSIKKWRIQISVTKQKTTKKKANCSQRFTLQTPQYRCDCVHYNSDDSVHHTVRYVIVMCHRLNSTKTNQPFIMPICVCTM